MKSKKLQYALSIPNLSIDVFLEKATPSSSPWWKDMSPFALGINSVKNILNLQQDYTTVSSAKACPGIMELLNSCYIIKFPCDVVLRIDGFDTVGDPGYSWKTPDEDLLNIHRHGKNQYINEKSNNQLYIDKTNIKFCLPVNFLSSKTQRWIFLPPVYHNNNVEYEVVPGVMKVNSKIAMPLNVNTMFPVLKDTKDYYFKAGTPMGYLLNIDGKRSELTKIDLSKGDGRTRRFSFLNNYHKMMRT